MGEHWKELMNPQILYAEFFFNSKSITGGEKYPSAEIPLRPDGPSRLSVRT